MGQLDDGFQKNLANEWSFVTRNQCRFYHSIELPDKTVIDGPWDLRGRERDYLGQVDLKNKRVLEMGPSSGYLTFWMESQGADVVGFDCGWDASIDLMPAPGGETRKLRSDHAKMVSDFTNSWWYLHRELQSNAKAVYGDVYNLPGDLGQFDISTFGCILLHTKSPISILEQAARRTTSTIVVTESWTEGYDSLMSNTMRPFPNGEDGRWVTWWLISAGAVVEMLKVLGFGDTEVIEHKQLHQHGHDPSQPYVEQPMYTVVGRRN